MNILIIGGTGILSTDFTKKTLDEGHNVWILNRGTRKSFIDCRANLIVADLRGETIECIKAKLRGCSFDVVVDFLSYNPDHIRKSLQIVEGCFRQYVFISSATAYVNNGVGMIEEDSTPIGNSDWEYSFNKSQCEEWLAVSDVNYTIIRPYVTYGISRIPFQIIPDGFHYTLLERIRCEKPVVMLDGGNAICTLTNTKDFANMLYLLLLNPKAYRQAFHITSTTTLPWSKVYELYCKILNRKPVPFTVTLEDVSKYYPEGYQLLKGDKGKSWVFDNSKIMNAIGGYKTQVDLEEGLRDSVTYFVENEDMQAIDYGWDGKMDCLIRHVSGIKLHKCDYQKTKNSTKKILYYIHKNRFTRFVFIILWKLKHRRNEGSKNG